MYTFRLAATLLGLSPLFATAFAAEPAPTNTLVTEQAVETRTTTLPMPRRVPGSVTVRPCDNCVPITLQVDQTSRYFLTRKEVPFDEFRRFAQANGADVVVLFDPKSDVVTRIIATGTAR